jgi:hypothetical protein
VRVTDTAGGENTQTFTITISGSVNGIVQGNVYNDLDKNGDRQITNPNNLTPDTRVEIGDRFKKNYTPYRLELPNGLPVPIGPMVFLPGDPDTMLIGGGIASCGGSIYRVKVLRGEGGHIIGFDDDGDPNTPYVAEFYHYSGLQAYEGHLEFEFSLPVLLLTITVPHQLSNRCMLPIFRV